MISINDRLQQIIEKIQLYLNPTLDLNKQTRTLILIGVSKRFTANHILEAYLAGITHFGENYLQEALDKIDFLRQNHADIERKIIWHYIGQAQSNKCKYLVKYFDWVQTVDDIAFADKLNHEMKKYVETSSNPKNKNLQICLQVNIDNAPTKNGLKYEEALILAEYIDKNCSYLSLRGIMAMPDAADEQILSKYHQHAHELYLKMQDLYGEKITAFSIGMSQDMKVAIESGSTMLRVGQAIFGQRI